MILRLITLLTTCLWLSSSLTGQGYYRSEELPRSDSASYAHRLALRLQGQGFLRDNEHATTLADDYTLPGYRLQIDLGFRPESRLPMELRLGVEHLGYWGASRYPAALAYRDLPYWNDTGSYTRLRLLPFFQASILPTPHLTITLGTLEGGIKHELIPPLYNPELNLTADSEHGFQLRYVTERTFVDTWIDWQSFIFKGANHQEAFLFGLHARRALLLRAHSRLEVDFQGLAQHRGGVFNERPDTVHTWLNAALGLRYTQEFLWRDHPLKWRTALLALGYSQRGEHYPADRGSGLYLQTDLFWRRWQLQLGGWLGHDYIAPLGSPFAQSLHPQQGPSAQPSYTHHTRYLAWLVSYHLLERSSYTLGASVGGWLHPHGQPSTSTFAEVYLSLSPYLPLLKR